MSETPPVPVTEEAKKRLRDNVDKLLAAAPSRSEGSITLGGRKLKYEAVADFHPVTGGGPYGQRGKPQARRHKRIQAEPARNEDGRHKQRETRHG